LYDKGNEQIVEIIDLKESHKVLEELALGGGDGLRMKLGAERRLEEATGVMKGANYREIFRTVKLDDIARPVVRRQSDFPGKTLKL
jgi:hypothetical protein